MIFNVPDLVGNLDEKPVVGTTTNFRHIAKRLE